MVWLDFIEAIADEGDAARDDVNFWIMALLGLGKARQDTYISKIQSTMYEMNTLIEKLA